MGRLAPNPRPGGEGEVRLLVNSQGLCTCFAPGLQVTLPCGARSSARTRPGSSRGCPWCSLRSPAPPCPRERPTPLRSTSRRASRSRSSASSRCLAASRRAVSSPHRSGPSADHRALRRSEASRRASSSVAPPIAFSRSRSEPGLRGRPIQPTSPPHDQWGMGRPSGTSSSDRW